MDLDFYLDLIIKKYSNFCIEYNGGYKQLDEHIKDIKQLIQMIDNYKDYNLYNKYFITYTNHILLRYALKIYVDELIDGF